MRSVPKDIQKILLKYNIEGVIGGYSSYRWKEREPNEYYTARGGNGMPLCVFVKGVHGWELTDDYIHLKPKRPSATVTCED